VFALAYPDAQLGFARLRIVHGGDADEGSRPSFAHHERALRTLGDAAQPPAPDAFE